MRRYETTYILRPNLGEEQFSEIIERTNKIVKGDGGAVINLERWGTKKLAYEIKKEAFGHYIYFDYAALGTNVHEMERIFRIDDRVLRYLTVKIADTIDGATIASETERAVAIAAAKTAKTDEGEKGESEAGPENEEESEDFADED